MYQVITIHLQVWWGGMVGVVGMGWGRGEYPYVLLPSVIKFGLDKFVCRKIEIITILK